MTYLIKGELHAPIRSKDGAWEKDVEISLDCEETVSGSIARRFLEILHPNRDVRNVTVEKLGTEFSSSTASDFGR